MHVTARLAGQEDVDVEVGEECRSLQALKEAIVKELPQLCVEGFDVSLGGRALDNDEGVVSLVASATLDVVPNARGLSVLALREAGHEVSEAGLLQTAARGDVSLTTLYLDAGLPVDCVKSSRGWTPLHLACIGGHLPVATLLLDRGSRAIDKKDGRGWTPLHNACRAGYLALTTLLLDRGSCALDEADGSESTPLHLACSEGHCEIVALLLDRGSRAIDQEDGNGNAPLHLACRGDHEPVVALLLDRGCSFDVEEFRQLRKSHTGYSRRVRELLLGHGRDA